MNKVVEIGQTWSWSCWHRKDYKKDDSYQNKKIKIYMEPSLESVEHIIKIRSLLTSLSCNI